jgi:hypothetical protein
VPVRPGPPDRFLIATGSRPPAWSAPLVAHLCCHVCAPRWRPYPSALKENISVPLRHRHRHLPRTAPLPDASGESPSQAVDLVRCLLLKAPLCVAQPLGAISFFSASQRPSALVAEAATGNKPSPARPVPTGTTPCTAPMWCASPTPQPAAIDRGQLPPRRFSFAP